MQLLNELFRSVEWKIMMCHDYLASDFYNSQQLKFHFKPFKLKFFLENNFVFWFACLHFLFFANPNFRTKVHFFGRPMSQLILWAFLTCNPSSRLALEIITTTHTHWNTERKITRKQVMGVVCSGLCETRDSDVNID